MAIRGGEPGHPDDRDLGPSPFDVAVDMANGRAFVLATRPDTASTADLNIVDTATGSLLRTVPAGPMPTTLTVDDRVGRVFVAAGAQSTCAYFAIGYVAQCGGRG